MAAMVRQAATSLMRPGRGLPAPPAAPYSRPSPGRVVTPVPSSLVRVSPRRKDSSIQAGQCECQPAGECDDNEVAVAHVQWCGKPEYRGERLPYDAAYCGQYQVKD